MTTPPQTHQRNFPAQDGRRRAAGTGSAAPESDAARSRARESLPAVDSSTAFGCVDWFLYPETEPRVGA